MRTNDSFGVLYVVATPIGNLEDISSRAVSVLSKVSVIAAEDTRHSRKLTAHFGLSVPMLSLHDFNEKQKTALVLSKLGKGEDVALVSDAGTPLISDPGYHLVHEAREMGVRVVPVPGACALIAALSAAGLPTDRFCFEGFLSAKQGARQKQLEALRLESRTMVFYESPRRISDCLTAMCEVFGPQRKACVARELTKQYETIHSGTLKELAELVSADSDQQRGEFAVVVSGEKESTAASTTDQLSMLRMLMQELPLKKAAAITAKITGGSKNELYSLGLEEGKAE